MTLPELLAAAGIAPGELGTLANGFRYCKSASQAERDARLAKLSQSAPAAGWLPLVLGYELFDKEEEDPRLQPAAPARVEEAFSSAHEQLALLDRFDLPSEPQRSPNYVRALLGWRDAHPAGAPLGSLMESLRAAPVETCSAPKEEALPEDEGEDDTLPLMEDELTLGLFEVRHGHELLARLGFGNFNACPDTAVHVAAAMRWERDFGARLVYLGPDRYAFEVEPRALSEREQRRLISEHAQLGADESPPPGALSRLRYWYFWWD
jgi:hypothetical protein